MKFYELLYEFNQSKNAKDTFEIYFSNFQSCNEHKLEIITSDKNMALNIPIFKDIMDLSNIMTIFEYPNLAFYSPKIVKGMTEGKRVPLAVDYSISFESNSAKYLHDYLTKGTCNIKDFEIALHTLLKNNYNLDPMFYMIETFAKGNKSSDFYENLYSIKKLMTCDMNYYFKTKKIKSIFTDKEVEIKVKEDLYHLENNFKSIKNKAKEQQLTMKIILLAMAFARFKYKTEKERVSYLVKFMSEKMKAIFLRELIIAINYFYFENIKDKDLKSIEKDKHKFFNPLNGQSEIKFFEELDGMAWDFTIVRQLEMYFSSKPNPDADFFIPFLFTYDKGLIEVMKMFYCKDFLIFHEDKRTIPIPAIDRFDMKKIEEYGLSHYFTEEAISNRLQDNNVDFEKIYDELKDDFIKRRIKN
jgi:hypothetical protein